MYAVVSCADAVCVPCLHPMKNMPFYIWHILGLFIHSYILSYTIYIYSSVVCCCWNEHTANDCMHRVCCARVQRCRWCHGFWVLIKEQHLCHCDSHSHTHTQANGTCMHEMHTICSNKVYNATTIPVSLSLYPAICMVNNEQYDNCCHRCCRRLWTTRHERSEIHQ